MATDTLIINPVQHEYLLERVELLRLKASQQLAANRAEKGQFFTPQGIAQFMAGLFTHRPDTLQVLDPGAGVGSLSAALVAAACMWQTPPARIEITAYEIDPVLREYLQSTLEHCYQICRQKDIDFDYEIIPEDFIEAGIDMIMSNKTLFAPLCKSFNTIIMNPPYKKIHGKSRTRRLLQKAGIETSNLYTAFFWIAIELLEPDGEIVAITPRSFCNGPYFLPFRKAFLSTMSLQRIHVFEHRDRAFQDEDVLQENIIVHAAKAQQRNKIAISASEGPDDAWMSIREVTFDQVVKPDDPALFIRIVPDTLHQHIGQHVERLSTSLSELGVQISTGRVVDFRVREFLCEGNGEEKAPLIYPNNFLEGYITWPGKPGKKPNAIKIHPATASLLLPRGWYVLVKRFSAKEEKRRLVAAVYNPDRIDADLTGFENHVNYYHQDGHGLLPALAKGIAAFLNSTIADEYFRQFSGHTQVNATDLRNFRYPTKDQLIAIGERIGETFPPQQQLDDLVIERLGMATTSNDLQARKKIEEAMEILRALQVPRALINQRSALTLLALSNVKPDSNWADASAPLYGITEMMNYFRVQFGITYAPNTHETVRRQTIHQFVQMNLVIPNPDDPNRPINSPKTRYQIESNLLALITSFGTDAWENKLRNYLATAQGLQRLRERERSQALIPVRLPDGSEINITAGGQNTLIKQIIEDFCPRFTPGGVVIYVGDAGDKFKLFERTYFEQLGVHVNEHSKMPDVIIHVPDQNWLVLIEAVTSHGPINMKRHNELKDLFRASKSPLVFVTVFPTRKVMKKYLQEIAWATEVWIAESPGHIIHFNGERFLGPYE